MCWGCPDYPCTCCKEFDEYDSFAPLRRRAQDIALVRRLRLKAYPAEPEEKRAVLDILLERYNDGRRKTFFNTAIYLLPLEDLRSVMAALNSRPELAERPAKDRALAALEYFQPAAGHRGVSLKLNRKPKKR